MGGTAAIGAKSHLSKLVSKDETGKIMSFIATVETVGPVIATAVFSYIFKYTIDSDPGAVYQFTACLVIIPILGLIWIDRYTQPLLCEGEDPEQPQSCENENDDQGGEQTIAQKQSQNTHHGRHSISQDSVDIIPL